MLVWGELWVLQKRWGMVLVGEPVTTTVEGRSIIVVLFQRDLWVPQQTGGVWCLSGGDLCQLLTDNLLKVIQFCTEVHCACQQQCRVCLGSHLTKPCLSCLVPSKTAAIHVRWQHNMCNFLGCKILQGLHPTA